MYDEMDIYIYIRGHEHICMGWVGLDWIGLDRIMLPGYQNTTLA